MDILITFFRDILDGPVYIIVVIISVILICSCIGYLAEQSQMKRKKNVVENDTNSSKTIIPSNQSVQVNQTTSNLSSGDVVGNSVSNTGIINQTTTNYQNVSQYGAIPSNQPITGQFSQPISNTPYNYSTSGVMNANSQPGQIPAQVSNQNINMPN